MHIAMVGPFGFEPNKTMRSRALPLARALVQRGHAVRLLMPPWHTPEQADRTWEEDGVSIRYTPLGNTAVTTAHLLRETLASRPDIVHTFKPKAYSGLVAWWLWQFQRRRLRLVLDTDDWEGAGGWNERGAYTAVQRRFFQWQEGWGLTHCHALTVASRALETLALARGVPPAHVHYVPNGPGIGLPDPAAAAARRRALGLSDRPVLLLYSRLFEFDTTRLVAVLQRVRTAVPALALLWVGAPLDDIEGQRFQEQLAAAGLADCLVNAGWVPEAEVPAVLDAADVAIYPMDDTLLNRTKCPVKLADLLQVGLPVVAEAVGQTTAYVRDGMTGCLRSSGDVAGLAKDIIALLNDEERRTRFGRAAQAHLSQQFAWPALAERLELAYEG